jgi:hypothetical protein
MGQRIRSSLRLVSYRAATSSDGEAFGFTVYDSSPLIVRDAASQKT